MLTGALALLALQAPLRISSPGLTVSEVLADASRQSGVPLAADARAGAEIVAIRMEGEPVEWLMDRAAWCTGGTWKPQGSGWILERTQAQEAALIRQANQATAAHLQERIQAARKILPRMLQMAFSGQAEEAEQQMEQLGPDMQQYMMLAMFWPALEQIGLGALVGAQPGVRSVYTARPNRFQSGLSQAAAIGIGETFNGLIRMMMQASASQEAGESSPEAEAAMQAFRQMRFEASSSRIILQRLGRQVVVVASSRPTGAGSDLIGGMGEMPMFLNFSLDGPDAQNANPFPEASLASGPQTEIGSDTDLADFKKRFIDDEPLRAYGGAQLLAAAESAKRPFIALLPDELLGSPFQFGLGMVTARSAEARAAMAAESGIDEEAPAQAAAPPEDASPLLRRLAWKEGAARPVLLGRSIEERFPRAAMKELWRRHVEGGEGHLEAALHVLRFVPPAAWSGGYIGIVQAALPWLQNDAGFEDIAGRPAAIQFLASLQPAQRQAISREAWTRFDPGMAVRIEAVLASSSEQMMETGSGDATTVMGSLPPGGWSLELSADSDGMVMARDTANGQIQMMSPESLGEHLGRYEDPAYADQRPHMPDFRSFSSVDRRVYRFMASAPRPEGAPSSAQAALMRAAAAVSSNQGGSEMDAEMASNSLQDDRMTVSLEVPDIRRPAASYAGLNRLPADMQKRIEASRKAARNQGHEFHFPPPAPSAAGGRG